MPITPKPYGFGIEYSIWSFGNRSLNGLISTTVSNLGTEIRAASEGVDNNYGDSGGPDNNGPTYSGGPVDGWLAWEFSSPVLMTQLALTNGYGAPRGTWVLECAATMAGPWTAVSAAFEIESAFSVAVTMPGADPEELTDGLAGTPASCFRIRCTDINPGGDGTNWASGTLFAEATFYLDESSLCGGNREEDIVVTTDMATLPVAGSVTTEDVMILVGNNRRTYNGGPAGGPIDAIAFAPTSTVGSYLRFAFPVNVGIMKCVLQLSEPEVLDSADVPTIYGTWKLQGANDVAGPFTDVGSPFQFPEGQLDVLLDPGLITPEYFPVWQLVLVTPPAGDAFPVESRMYCMMFDLTEEPAEAPPLGPRAPVQCAVVCIGV